MHYLFEFYDKNNVITKSGVLDPSVILATSYSDETYVIKDSDTGKIVKRGKLGKAESKSEVLRKYAIHAILPNIILFSCDGITQYEINGEEQAITIKDDLLYVPNITGTHKVTTVDDSFYFENKNYFKDTHELAFDIESEKVLAEGIALIDLKDSYTSKQLIEKGLSKLNKTFQKLNNEQLTIEQRGQNIRIKKDSTIDRVFIYKVEAEDLVFKKTLHSDRPCLLEDSCTYLLKGYLGDLFVTSELIYVPNSQHRTTVWKENQDKNERLIYSQKNKDAFDYFSVAKEESPHYKRYGTPVISLTEDHFHIDIYDYEESLNLREPIYLCAATKEELVLGKYQYKQQIGSALVLLDKINIESEDDIVFFWIQGSAGEKISDLALVNLFDEEIEGDSSVKTLIDEALEAKALAGDQSYLIQLIDAFYVSAKTSNRKQRLEELMKYLFEKAGWIIGGDVILGITKLLEKEIHVSAIQEQPLILNQWSSTLLAKEGHSLIAYVFNDARKEMTKVITNEEEIYLNQDHYLLRCYDNKTNRYSALICFSNKNNEPSIKTNYGLLIEVK